MFDRVAIANTKRINLNAIDMSPRRSDEVMDVAVFNPDVVGFTPDTVLNIGNIASQDRIVIGVTGIGTISDYVYTVRSSGRVTNYETISYCAVIRCSALKLDG